MDVTAVKKLNLKIKCDEHMFKEVNSIELLVEWRRMLNSIWAHGPKG